MRLLLSWSLPRRRMVVGALSLSAVLALAPVASASEPVPAANVRQNMYSTCFADDTTGWAVGDLGRIFYTRDGAQTWEIQGAGTKRPFLSVSCLDGQRAWIAGQAGQMARTTDGGSTWQSLTSGTDRQLLSIAFVNDRLGIAVGDQGTILRTQDAGVSWTAVPVPEDTELPEEYEGIVEPSDVVLYSAAWAGPTTVVIVGEFGVTLVSRDAGLTFESRSNDVQTTLFGVSFADERRGWAVGMESTMLATSDGGETWRRQVVQSPPGFALSLYDVKVRGNLGWAVGNSGFLLHSSDGGSNWKLIDVPPQLGSYWLREVYLQANGKGVVVGQSGLVLALDGASYKPNKDQL